MGVRNTFLIVLFAILLSHSVIAQSTDESTASSWMATDETSLPPLTITTSTSETTPTIPSCKDNDEFPLFSDDVCISRTAYTAIFLTSIILAGVSFLMLIGLLILCCIRSSRSSGSSYTSDNESNPWKSSNNRNGNISATPPANRRVGQYTTVLQNEKEVPSAPYTDAKPVALHTTRTERTITTQQNIANQKPVEALEMVPPKTRNKPTNDRRGRNHTGNDLPNEETETSYF